MDLDRNRRSWRKKKIVVLTLAASFITGHLIGEAHPKVSAQTGLQPKQLEIHERGPRYSIDMSYPQIEGANQFNKAVRETVMPTVRTFKRAMGELHPEDFPNYEGYLRGHYTLATSSSGIVSVVFDFDEYTPGAAHPWGTMASVNYDHRAKKVLTISDLFRAGTPYLQRLSELSITALNETLGEGALDPRGVAPVEGNFKVFALTDDALTLHFPTYQVAAGAAGPQKVTIPLKTLVPLLRPQFAPRH